MTSNSGNTVTLTVGGCTVAAGDKMQVIASGVSNPTLASTGNVLAVSTSSTPSGPDEHVRDHGGGDSVLAIGHALDHRGRATNVTYTT